MILNNHPERSPGSTEQRMAHLAAPPWSLVLQAEPLVSEDDDGCSHVDLGVPILDAGGAALAYVMVYPGEEGDPCLRKTLAAGALMAEAPNLVATAETSAILLNVALTDLSRPSFTLTAANLRVKAAYEAVREVELALRRAVAATAPPAGQDLIDLLRC